MIAIILKRQRLRDEINKVCEKSVPESQSSNKYSYKNHEFY